MGGFAWVTLATNDSYSLGALVLAHSLKRVNTAHQLAIMITPGVSEAMRTQLSAVFNVVKLVDVLDSKDQENLALLARPELGITFTKLHCWKLTQFDKCVFLDADTIVLQNSDELFEREELSAAPDVGWPDCFNSGVFVFKPSEKTFKDLIDFALVHGTFDGGDQGLLNLFFSDWATKDISKHLPFVYNVVSSTVYTYLPAFKQFKDKLKIIHFIGSSKPWLQPFDTETGVARVSGDAQTQSTFIQLWWDLFCAYVHPTLTSSMVGLAGALSAVKLGAPQSEEQNALQEHLRRQGWEEGNIDYMGRDSFDNIWKKISETLAGGTPPSQPAESTTQQAPVAENVPPSVVPDVIAAPPSVPSTLPSSEVTPTPPETIPTPPITQSQEKPVESVPAPISEPPKTGTELTEKTEEVLAIVPTTPAATQPTPQPDLKTTETKSSGSDSLEKPTAVLQPSIEQKPTEEIKLTELAPTSPTLDQTKLESAPIPPEPLKTDIKPAESAAEQKPDSTSTPEVPQQVELAKIDLVTPKADSIPESITSPPVPETSPAPAVPTPTSPQTVETQPTLPPQETTPAPQVLPSAQTTQEHPPSQIGQTPSVLEPLESGKITSVSEGPKETASDKSDLTPPPSPGQGAVPESKPTPPTPSTPTVTSPTPPASPAAAPQELPTAASKLKVQPETPPTPPVPQSAAQPTLPGSTGDEPPVPPKRKGGKGGSGAATAPPAAQGESASKSQQPKGGKGGKGKK